MHCVGEYPTKPDTLNLNQIDLLKQRYPGVTVGYSTHEEPDNMESIQIAIAKGASIFEKHVAVETEAFKKNEYSATPDQITRWLQSAERAYRMSGVVGTEIEIHRQRTGRSQAVQARCFRNAQHCEGRKDRYDKYFFCLPQCGRPTAGQRHVKIYGICCRNRILKDLRHVKITDITCIDQRERIYSIVQQVKKILSTGNVVVPGMATLEDIASLWSGPI